MDPVRIVAVDWSGAKAGARRKIWLAEVEDGRVLRLECGRDRNALTAELIRLRQETASLVVGLDFAFSLPSWFLHERGLADGPALWRLVEAEGERWLAACEPPFWGRPGKRFPTPDVLPDGFRRTDSEVPPIGGIRPKSVFQIGGAGAVGTGSLRGMPALARLHDEGFAIWPFDEPRLPLVVEIYPRALTGAVSKGREAERARYLESRYAHLDARVFADATRSDDAFDALVSALVMAEHTESFRALPPASGEQERLEGRIWLPDDAARADRRRQPSAALHHRTTVAPLS